jgi:8-oxo-dGTP pyrophosphatase MutT (NUDIX family)
VRRRRIHGRVTRSAKKAQEKQSDQLAYARRDLHTDSRNASREGAARSLVGVPRLSDAMMVRFDDDDFTPLDRAAVDNFGAWLREARERAGLSLDDIAASTKVGRRQIQALERNDLSHWPAGIFRRAFVRTYAGLVSIDPDRTVAIFLRAFPEPLDGPDASPGAPPSSRAVRSREEGGLRLTLAPEALRWQAALARLGAAATDLMAPITVALPSGLLGGEILFWMVLAVVAVLYITVGTLVLGTTPGLWMMQWMGSQPLGARRWSWRSAVGRSAHADEAVDAEVSPAHHL